MGAVVAELADLAVVTTDNPRTEEPHAIIATDPAGGAGAVLRRCRSPHRDPAAIAEATPGDVVVIAGKGHEDYQILGDQRSTSTTEETPRPRR